MSRIALLLLAAALTSGCALSPQTLDLSPTIEIASSNRGNNQPVTVFAIDSRGQEAFGTRGGAYPKTSLIRPAGSVQDPIAESVREGLQRLGFNAFNPGEGATELELRLEQLDYVPEQGSVVNEVTLALTLQAEARREDTSHTGTYKSTITHNRPFTPSPVQNEKMINEILSTALARLLSDEEMLAFLAGETQ